ncbi:MAG: hypothetical protein AAF589_04495 [Planctomycetota bacterium]
MLVHRFCLLATLATLLPSAGCTAWQTRNWDLDQLRDPRATSLEERLDNRAPAVTSPFDQADND